MEDFIRDTYLQEAATQCTFALNAVRGLNSVVARLPDATRSGDVEKSRTLHAEVFRSIHSLLTHASNVSRIFWPAPPRRRKGEPRSEYRQRCADEPKIIRGRSLRESIGLPEHGHALRSRRMRDHLEHFDERLDDWRRTSRRRNMVQDFIGPVGGIVGIESTDMMRWFDPTTQRVLFRGEQYDLQSLADALTDVRNRIDRSDRGLTAACS